MNKKSDYEKNIGKNVVSNNFGVGEIIGVDDLGLKEGLFYVISHQKKKLKSYLSITNNPNYRIVTDRESYSKLTSMFDHSKFVAPELEKKERIAYFKSKSNSDSLLTLLETASELSKVKDLAPPESSILRSIVSSLSTEHSLIFDSSYEESQSYIQSLIKGETNE